VDAGSDVVIVERIENRKGLPLSNSLPGNYASTRGINFQVLIFA
jgi:hypothetical protein